MQVNTKKGADESKKGKKTSGKEKKRRANKGEWKNIKLEKKSSNKALQASE